MDSVVLKGKDVFSKFNVLGEKLLDKADKPYYRARFNGKVLTVREDVFTDWKAGNIAELNLITTTYENEAGETISGYAYDTHMTATQELGIAKHAAEITKIERSVMAVGPLDAATVAQLEMAD